MRKQTKLAVVLAAAALLAVGSASMVSASGWVQEGAEWRYQDASGDYVTEAMKKSGDTTFYLDENGYMAKDYFCNYNDNYYYFGSNGAMVRNTWVAIDPSLVDSGDEDVDAYWYYFQDTGKAFKGGDSDVKKKKIDGKTYFFNSDGQMMTGWFDGSGEKYHPDEDNEFLSTVDEMYFAGDDGVARGGWLAYTDGLMEEYEIGESDISDRATLYFYFNTSNFKRTYGKEKTINGKKYRFDACGVMYTGWEYAEVDQNGNLTADGKFATMSAVKYYSGEDDGHLVKKGWVYAVPSKFIDSEKNDDDEEAYFYFNNNGTMVAGQQKRINGKYYVFNTDGIMKTGLIFLNQDNTYRAKVDLEYTDGADFIKMSRWFSGESAAKNKTYSFGAEKDSGSVSNKNDIYNSLYSVHYFGADGAKVTGNKILVEFADDVYTFASKNSGGFVGEKKKKFYSNGFLLKASEDIRLGLVIASETQARECVTLPTTGYDGTETLAENKFVFPQTVSANDDLALYCVTTSGSKKKKGAYKDADGNYWLINENNCVIGIYDCQVKYVKGCCQWKGNVGAGDWYWVNGARNKSVDGKDDTYLDFNTPDKTSGDLCQNAHLVTINNDYCLNFTIIDK